LDQQAVSRSFLATITDTDEDEERHVRKKIRTGLEYGSLLKDEDDTEKTILQQMGRILRNEGIRSVVVPFDPTEPRGADRRGTGQFIRLIKISAHENQFQRPILEMKDGSRHVIATYADLQNAAELWFEFEEAQAFKINHKVLKVFKSLPTTEPSHYNFTERSPSTNHIADETKIAPRSVERYLDDLYDAGLIFRKKASAPGNPYVFWTTNELRQKVMSQISASDDAQADLRQITTKNGCRKYLGENCPDCLKSSLSSFFTNYDIISTENVKGILFRGGKRETFVPGEKIISSLSFLQNRVVNTPIEATDSEYLRHDDLSEMPEEDGNEPEDGDSLRQDDSVVKEDDLSLQELLAREKERAAEDAERKKTPTAGRARPKKEVERSTTKNDPPAEKPNLSEPALKDLLDDSGEITPERYVAQAGGTVGAAIRQLDLAVGAYGWSKRKIGFSVIYGPGEVVG
jgi:predicted transcriptional regulator